ncbi:MAG: glycine cleavage system protein GcvH [Desulfurococcaceae archaeon]
MTEDIIVEIGRNKYVVKKDRRYTETDEWAKKEDDIIRIGITDYAQKELKDIVGIELPERGRIVNKGEEIGAIDSVKAYSPYYAPVSGEIIDINQELLEKPELINKEPYGSGWILLIKPSNPEEYDKLLTPEQYVEKIKKSKH